LEQFYFAQCRAVDSIFGFNSATYFNLKARTKSIKRKINVEPILEVKIYLFHRHDVVIEHVPRLVNGGELKL